MFHEICDIAMQCINDAHHILQEEANEILAFLAADSKCVQVPGVPCHLPIAYALKGSSLNIDTMRQLIESVRDTCMEYDIDVLCEVYDGQFLLLVLRGENGHPLT